MAGTDLVADQSVGGGRVGHAQQRLGQTHQHHALFAGERIFLGEGVEARMLVLRGADAGHKLGGKLRGRLRLGRAEPGLVDEAFENLVFVGQEGVRKGLAQICRCHGAAYIPDSRGEI